MSKKINKDTTDSEELFKRLETGNDEGLDDFEKEALEGFAALNDVKLSKKLNNELNTKINDVYFKPASKKNNLAFLSMAAGLLLMIGVSIFFYQYLNEQKKDVAMSEAPKTETTVMEKKDVPSLEQSDAMGAAEQKEPAKTAAVVVDKMTQHQAPKDLREESEKNNKSEGKKSGGEGLADDQDVATNTGGVASVPTAVADEKPKNQVTESQGARRNNSGPAGNSVGAAGGKSIDKKDVSENDREEKSNKESLAKEKAPATKQKEPVEEVMPDNNAARSASDYKSKEDVAATKKGEDAQNNENKERAKVSSRDASKLKKAAKAESSIATSPAKGSETPGYFTLNFSNTKYNTAQDYIRSEIEKDAVLKENVKDFKAKLFVDETGKVIKVNFINDFKKCKDCDERLGKIILNMPGWNSAPALDKTLNRETTLSYPK